ncbi:MAG: hypothetical protein IJH04_03495, partial [Eggerthellaceae bacterium]|nr:hypothetical protein [Eggerthellaceae bacterium]
MMGSDEIISTLDGVISESDLAKQGITSGVKRAALYKLIDYLMEDPETNVKKIMERLDALAPKSLFTNQRLAFRNAIENESN